jgi:hypothetical protein
MRIESRAQVEMVVPAATGRCSGPLMAASPLWMPLSGCLFAGSGRFCADRQCADESPVTELQLLMCPSVGHADRLLEHRPLAEQIDGFWCDPVHRRVIPDPLF